MDKQYILFDLDGTLTDPKVGITKSVQHSLRSFGIDVPDCDELIKFIGPPLRDSYKLFYGFDDDGAEKAVAKYREYFAETGIFENTVYSGIDEMLSALRVQGKTLILATSKPAVYAVRILERFGLGEYFTFVSGSELDGRRSKKSEVIAYALENCHIPSVGRAVMVGDREHDITGARAHCMDSVGVTYGYGSAEELYAAGANFVTDSVAGLAAILYGGGAATV